MSTTKYTNEAKWNLIAIAKSEKQESVEAYINDLFETAQNSCYEDLYNKIYDNPYLRKTDFIEAQKIVDSVHQRSCIDINNYKSIMITDEVSAKKKLSAFRYEYLTVINPKDCLESSAELKAVIGNPQQNLGRENIAKRDPALMSDYLALTKPIRVRFTKKLFKDEIAKIERLIGKATREATMENKPTEQQPTQAATPRTNKPKLTS